MPRRFRLGQGPLFRSFALAAALALAACSPERDDRPACPPGKTCLLIGNGAEPISLDPHKVSGTWEDRIISDAIMGLVQDDAAGRPIPNAFVLVRPGEFTRNTDALGRFRLDVPRDSAWTIEARSAQLFASAGGIVAGTRDLVLTLR